MLPALEVFTINKATTWKLPELHLYSYVLNSPIIYTDPNGLHAIPSRHPTCRKCSGGNKPNVNNAAGRACDVIRTPDCQRALGGDSQCMVDFCNYKEPPIDCDEDPWCKHPDLRGFSPPTWDRIVFCTKHPDNQRPRGRAISIFHELLHQCKGAGPPDHVDPWKKAYTIPCFGTDKP